MKQFKISEWITLYLIVESPHVHYCSTHSVGLAKRFHVSIL